MHPTTQEKWAMCCRDLRDVHEGLEEAIVGWTKGKEEIEARRAYLGLQSDLIRTWPRSAVSDLLKYLGTGFLGGGGVAYAVLGPQAIVVYAFFWAVGIATLGAAVWDLRKYDKARQDYFDEVLSRVR